MKRELKIKDGEPLHKWLDRIAEYYGFGNELREMLGEVSKVSYIHGSRDCQDVIYMSNLLCKDLKK